MKCEEFEEVLSDYIEGELDRERAEWVEMHLLKCPVCCATLRGVQQVRLALHDLGRQSPPPSFEFTLSKCLQEETAVRSRQRWSRSMALGVALVMGLAILLWPEQQEEGFEYALQDWNQTLAPAWNADPIREEVYAGDQDLIARPSLTFQAPALVRTVSF